MVSSCAGLPYVEEDAAAEYRTGLGGERGGVVGWEGYWRFVKRQCREQGGGRGGGGGRGEVGDYLYAVLDELVGEAGELDEREMLDTSYR